MQRIKNIHVLHAYWRYHLLCQSAAFHIELSSTKCPPFNTFIYNFIIFGRNPMSLEFHRRTLTQWPIYLPTQNLGRSMKYMLHEYYNAMNF